MIVLNGFDKEDTDFEKLLTELREHFGTGCFRWVCP